MANITPQRLKELERAEAKLAALEAAGVDNWDGFDEALAGYRAALQDEADRETFLGDLLDALSLSAEVDFPSVREAGPRVTLLLAEAERLCREWGVTFKTPRRQ